MYRNLIWLALGAFAIGTEGFMISGILPGMALDLGVSIAAAGQLVTIFAFAYAVGSPLIAVATANVPRKALLIGAMTVFTLSNLAAALAPGYTALAIARVLLAVSAGTFMPASAGYASMTIAPDRRGRALSFIYSGMTIALVLGVPMGTLIAARFDWRATFIGVAALGAVALVGTIARLPRSPSPPAISLSRRLAVARRPEVLSVLLLTVLVLIGAFTVNTYFGAYLETVFRISPQGVAFTLFVIGVAAAIGNNIGGHVADRWDKRQFLILATGMMVLSFATLSLLAAFAPAVWAFSGVVGAITIWALFGWSLPAVQQVRLLVIDPHLAPVTLSLHSSAVYLGAAIGAVMGAATVQWTSLAMIGMVGAIFELFALGFLLLGGRSEHVTVST
ncbi:MFS transporter [Rhizobium lusitanum]|jgi:predicted MFS family arabinose efflux permease|uniref:Predicted arabinose efflux permease, MFS family n=1 Tax=Rhizobium lusitanum TaxID=293958 RepID=A0A1C3XC49_9HYPH|nr:MFS transporter [Rhizobium lusitanum]SCB49828.1 Predicted arabinose efflux permease, MFS family [Rhizobium lusitanum]